MTYIICIIFTSSVVPSSVLKTFEMFKTKNHDINKKSFLIYYIFLFNNTLTKISIATQQNKNSGNIFSSYKGYTHTHTHPHTHIFMVHIYTLYS